MSKQNEKKGFSYGCYKIVRKLLLTFYPKIKFYNLEKLPEDPCVIIANHCQITGAFSCDLFFPGEKAIWCAGEMCHKEQVADFALKDFFKYKPEKLKWLYKFQAWALKPILPFLFNNSSTIPVYRGFEVARTFNNTIKALEEGKNVIIFPESFDEYNNIVNKFHEGFVDIGKMYYNKTGKALAFAPMYLAPKLKSAYMEDPIYYDPSCSVKDERKRLCAYLEDTITAKGRSLPKHKVIPHNNIPKKQYKYNIEDAE